MSYPSMTLHGVLVLVGSLCLLAFKQLCRDAMLLTHGTSIARQHMKNKIYYALGGDDGNIHDSLLHWTRYVLWKFPHLPPYTHTRTHTQKKNQTECWDQRIGCLTCCLKHTLTTTHDAKEEKS